jgi:membrane protease YdiL (CAAX protease family)
MSGGDSDDGQPAVLTHLKAVVWGTTDGRLRATWRVLLAGLVIIPLAELVSVLVVGAAGLDGRLPIGALQATFLAIVLVGWARYVDERPLADYGISATPSWALDLVVGVAAVLLAWGVWFGVGTAAGWTGVSVSMSAPGGSIVLGLVAAVLALGLNVWFQDTVFWALVARNAGEGFHARGLTAKRAVVGVWLVGVLYFVLIHGPTRAAGVVNLVVGGVVFGLLYLHTGELALTIGAHLGNNLVANHVFVRAEQAGDVLSLFAVTGGVPGPAILSELAFPRMVMAYVLLLGWVWLRRGEVGISEEIVRWTER